ncbi:hypothetical protein [Umezawaea sp. NPDC059074]|uniref:hypothetical protein n=1 Tax=Umezawaea sp. NPDC059074 TaxID=3346716 RepID=UPI0036A3F258
MLNSNVLPGGVPPIVLSGQITALVESGLAHDFLIDGVPFRLWPDGDNPYLRDIKADQKEQFDTSPEAGEQSFGNWWLRSQGSMHGGAGQKYLDSGEPQVARIRFESSRYVYPWEPGELTLAGTLSLSNLGRRRAEQVTWSGVQKLALASSTNHQVQIVNLPGMGGSVTVSCGSTGVVQDIATDGASIFVAVNDRVYKIDPTGTATQIATLTFSGTVSLGYAKQRLIVSSGPKLYDVDPNGLTPSPAVKYTHPNASWNYTSIAEGPNAIYLVGRAGPFSDVSSMTITDSGSGITLGTPIVQLQAPRGELFNSIMFYLNDRFVLATSQGIRAGLFTPYGQPQYGALMASGNPTYSIGASGSLVYVGGKNSVWWVDLATQIDNAGRYAYALYADGLNGVDPTDTVTDITVYPDSTSGHDLLFGAMASGQVITQTSFTPSTAGTLTTSWFRFGTVEPKQPAYLRIEGTFPVIAGVTNPLTISVESDDGTSVTFPIEGGSPSYEFGLFGLAASQAFRLTVTLRDDAVGHGVQLRSWQMKALPTPRQYRELILPFMCFDSETDYRGKAQGYKGFCWDRLRELETAAEENRVVTVKDKLTSTSFQAVIRRCQFSQTSNPTVKDVVGGRVNLILRLV